MVDDYHGEPLLVRDGEAVSLSRVMVGDADGGEDFNEDYIRNLAFDHPGCLPIGEIDSAYLNPIPVCKELWTPAGPIDALYITEEGRLVVVEAKLWKNPEARRKVIGQILDYAKELKRWGYEDLQREVAKATKRKGNALFEIASEANAELVEADFVDAVSRSLSKGRFLLLVIGDGIKEGAASIAEFMQQTGTLEFTLGMVEMALYQKKDVGLFVQPRVLAKTEIIERTIFEIRDDRIEVNDSPSMEDDAQFQEESENQKWYREFWGELLEELRLDDPQQKIANVTKTGGIFFPMPPGMNHAWVSAYFVQNQGHAGVSLTFTKGELGDRIFTALKNEREQIDQELGFAPEWEDGGDGGKHWISTWRDYGRGKAKTPENRDEIKGFMADALNRYVNAFRPRLKRLTDKD